MPPKKKGATPMAGSSRSSRPRLQALRIVPHSTRLAPIALERLTNCENLKEMPEDTLKKAKLAHATILKGDVMYGSVADPIMFGIILTTDDEVYTWGEDLDGMLGNGKNYGSDQKIPRSRFAPKFGKDILHKVEELCGKEIVDIYASHYWSMFFAITASGDVYSWGLNETRQLGHSWSRSIVNVPKLIDSIHPAQKIVKVATSDFQTYVLTQEGEVFTWGITSNRFPLEPTKVLGPDGKALNNIVNIVCGCEFVVALDHFGKVYYQRKQISSKHSTRMEYMNIPGNVVQISTGHCHMLALTDAGKIIGWGKNSQGQLPPPFFPGKEKFSPKFIEGHLKHLQFIRVVALADFSVAELKSGGFYIWGRVCIDEKQDKSDPFQVRVRECSNLEEVFAKYCPCLLPQPLRGEQLPDVEGNDMDIADNVLEERVNPCNVSSDIISDDYEAEVLNTAGKKKSSKFHFTVSENEDISSDSSSTCTFVPIPTSTSTPRSKRIRKSRSLRNKIASKLGNASDSNDSSIPEPTPKKKAKIRARKSIALPAPSSAKEEQQQRQQIQSESESNNTTQSVSNSVNSGPNLLVQAQQSMASSSFASLPESAPAARGRKILKTGNVVFNVGNQAIRPLNITLKQLKNYEFFKEQLQRNSEITINNVSPAAFEAFLGFVEDDEVHLDKNDWENISSLKIFADAKGIKDKDLKEKCEQMLDFNADNAQDRYFACRENNIEEGRKLAFEVILKNCKKIKGKGLLDLNKFLPFPEDLHKLTGAILKISK